MEISQTNKNEWARYIIGSNNFDRKKVIFVGDALSDFNAAIDCGLHFVAKIGKNESNPFKEEKLNLQIKDLFDLEKRILKNTNY